jgi:hypothetical protein
MTRKKAAAAKGSGKREAIDNRAGEFYGRRNASGQFKEMDERGKSLARDRRQKAKTTVQPSQGDRGDQNR